MRSRKQKNPKRIPMRKETSTFLPQLPQEIIIEILLLLTVKTLSRFKCVSKTWNSIISQPDFIKSHLQTSKPNRNMILGYTKQSSSITFYSYLLDPFVKSRSLEDEKLITLDLGLDFYRLELVGSCNGLCCMRLGYDGLVIFNPSTRKYKLIPVTHTYQHLPMLSGFGYDDSKDDYKIVQVEIVPYSKNIKVKVYSLRANSWSKKPFSMTDISVLPQGIAFVCRNFHWAAEVNNSWIVISYDLKNDMFGELKLPHKMDVSEPYTTWILGVLNGCLCSIQLSRHHMVLWLMNEYGVEKSWNKIGYSGTARDWTDSSFSSIGVELDGVEDNCMFFYDLESLWMWNAEDGISRFYPTFMRMRNLPANTCEHINVVDYHESLVSPSFGEEKEIEDKSWISKMNNIQPGWRFY